MELTSDNVNKVFMDCLFDDDTEENRKEAIIIEGITAKFGLNPEAVEKHKKEIAGMLGQLPKQFQEDGGGGWSFLNACERADGHQWTGLHRNMEQLLVLGIASGCASYCMPRKMWKVLHQAGGMPYFVIKKEEK